MKSRRGSVSSTATAGVENAAPQTGVLVATGSVPEQDAVATAEEEYWRRLDALKSHRRFASRYIQTLDKFIRREDELKTEAGGRGSSASNKRKVAANVRSYLAHFCVICSESASEHTHKPNLRMLDAITRTLEAVYRRMGINMESVESMSAGPLGPGEALVPSSTPGFLRTLPYNAAELNWNVQRTRNKEEKYCYCGENKQEPAVLCTLCKNWFHLGCTSEVPKDGIGFLPFQVNYKFACSVCSSNHRERFQLTSCSWIESVIGGMAHLTWTTQRTRFKVKEIGNHLEEHWDTLCYQREKRSNWRGPLNSYFTNNKDRFIQEKPFWGLADHDPDGGGPKLQPCRIYRGVPKPTPGHEVPPPPVPANSSVLRPAVSRLLPTSGRRAARRTEPAAVVAMQPPTGPICPVCGTGERLVGYPAEFGEPAPVEEWVQCEFCGLSLHEVCVGYDKQIFEDGKWPALCPDPRCQRQCQNRYDMVAMRQRVSLHAEALPPSYLAQFLESKIGSARAAVGKITVRVLSNMPREVRPYAQREGSGHHKRARMQLSCMEKSIVAFYRCPDGKDLAFFGITSREYGIEAPLPYRTTACITCVEANQLYHCPGCSAHHDHVGAANTWICSTLDACKHARREVYHLLLLGYFEYLRARGMISVTMELTPPVSSDLSMDGGGGDDDDGLMFHKKPPGLYQPSEPEIERWFTQVMERAQQKGVVVSFDTNPIKAGLGFADALHSGDGGMASVDFSDWGTAGVKAERPLKRTVSEILRNGIDGDVDDFEGPPRRTLLAHLEIATDRLVQDDASLSLGSQVENASTGDVGTRSGSGALLRLCIAQRYQFSSMRHGKAATMMLLQRLLRPHESAVDLQLDAPSPAALLGGQPLLVEVMDDTSAALMDTPWKTDGCLGPLDDGFGAAFGGFGAADDDGGGPDSLLTRTFSGSLRGGGGMPHTSLGSIPVGQASVPSSFSGASMLGSGGSSGGGGGGALSLEPALLSGSSLPSLDSGPSAGPPGVSPSPRLASAEDASLARQLVARIEAQQPLAPMLQQEVQAMIGSCAGTARVIALLLDAVGPAPLCAALAAVSGLDQSALERRLVHDVRPRLTDEEAQTLRQMQLGHAQSDVPSTPERRRVVAFVAHCAGSESVSQALATLIARRPQ